LIVVGLSSGGAASDAGVVVVEKSLIAQYANVVSACRTGLAVGDGGVAFSKAQIRVRILQNQASWLNPAVLLIAREKRAFSSASDALGSNIQEVARIAGGACWVVAGQAAEITGKAAIGERVPSHLNWTGGKGEALVVDGDEAGIGAEAGFVGICDVAWWACTDASIDVHELIIVAGYALQPWSSPVVYSPRLGAGRVWGDARRRKAIIVSDIGVIWAAL
jgi:hypothetical protein